MRKPLKPTWDASAEKICLELVLDPTAPNRLDVQLTLFFRQQNNPNQDYSRSQIQKWLKEKKISHNGEFSNARAPVANGDKIEIQLAAPKKLSLRPVAMEIEVLFEDDALAVIVKPKGLTVHPSSTQDGPTLVHALLHTIKNLSSIGGVERPGIVHRLDQNTSGVMLVTKTDRAHRNLQTQFARHTIDRKYVALVYSENKWPGPAKGPFEVIGYLGRDPKARTRMQLFAEEATGRRYSKTQFTPLQKWGNFYLLGATLFTGRTHQVRAHLRSFGFSIFNDTTYGGVSPGHRKFKHLPEELRAGALREPGQFLHALSLGFTHPESGKRLHFERLPTGAFAAAIHYLETTI